MDFPRLAVFQTVARRLSFSQAADELHLSQPAVSRHIQQLELELGVLLFHRLGNRVELTDAGQIMVDYAQRVTVLSEEVRRVLGELEGLKRGELKLSASSTPGLYWLPEVMAQYSRRYPDIRLSLRLGNSAEVARSVLAGEAAVGFSGIASSEPGLQVRPFAQDEIVLIVPAGHHLAHHTNYVADMLARETLILREPGSGTRRLVEERLAHLGQTLDRVIEFEGSEGVKRAVAAGLGIGFASRRAVVMEATQGILQVVEVPELTVIRPLLVLARKDARPSAAALAFLALMTKVQSGSGLGQP
jgi:LysR family transcriptional regulator, transcriptional activator of the cysJI operon